MDEKQSEYRNAALPDYGGFPLVDDHLVLPEITRDEIINGRQVVAFPADSPHATQHGDLHYVLRAHVAPGYRGALGLLTRYGEESDFASASCVYKDGVDPSTGTRYLEEMTFEMISEHNEQDVTEKAVAMQRRGVRRIFALFLEEPRLSEWSPGSQSWHPLDAGSRIEDPCLAAPLPVAALLDANLADNAVAEALIAKGNPAILNLKAAAEARGEARSILKILDMRGIAVSPELQEEILRCSDLDRLDRWLHRAAFASSADELTLD
jgi:hypothetical protein